MGWVRDRRVLLGLGVAYAVALVVLVAGPWGWALNRLTVRFYVWFTLDLGLAPGALPEDYGVLLNVLLFVPAGALLALLVARPWWGVVLVLAGASAVVELAQGLWLDREATWVDVAANTFGAALGVALVSPLRRRRGRRGGRSASPRRR